MRLRKRPLFRKVIIPWYHSDLFCLLISVFMALVFSFSIVGVRVAMECKEYEPHCWVPLVLTGLSGIVLAANLIRLLRRMIRRHAEAEEN